MNNERRFTHDQQRAAYDALGLDPELFNSTHTITIKPDRVIVWRYLRNADGHRYLVGGQPAEDVTVLDLASVTDR